LLITAAATTPHPLTSCGRSALGWVGLHPAHQVLAAKQFHALAVEHAGPAFNPALAAQRLGKDHQRVGGLILQRGQGKIQAKAVLLGNQAARSAPAAPLTPWWLPPSSGLPDRDCSRVQQAATQ
jgi:hypothetical protein